MEQPSWLDRIEYPFTPHVYETVHGRMHYIDEGDGAPLVFVHGVPTWSFLFRRAIAVLSARYRCVAPDLLGFGLSDKPQDFDYDPAELSRHVGDLIESLHLERVTLVVHDWGGPLALPYVFRRRENVAGLVISNTWMWPVGDDRRAALLGRILASNVFGALERRYAVMTRFVAWAAADRRAIPPAAERQYRAPLEREEDRVAVIALSRAIMKAKPWLAVQWQQSSLLRGLPALLLWGMRDRIFTSRDLDRWRALFVEPEVHRLERVGHFPPEEAGDLYARAIAAFLSERCGTSDADAGGGAS